MIAAVIDTHALIWWLYNDVRLSKQADQFISVEAAANNTIAVSSITLVEVVYLIEKGRISSETLSVLARILRAHESVFVEDRSIWR